MPVHANLLCRRLHHFLNHKSHQRQSAHGSGVSCGIADHNGPRAAIDRCRIEPLHCLGIAAGRVLGHIHRVEAERNRIFHGLLGGVQKKIVRPTFGETANGARSDEGCRFDRQTRLLHNLRNRADIVLKSARRTVGTNLHLVRDDLPRQRRHMLHCARSCAGQPQVKRVNPQRLHQMKNFNFLGDRGIAHRRRLQSIAQALIVQQHRPRRLQSRRMNLVPVVDEFGSVHGRVPTYGVPGTASTRARY